MVTGFALMLALTCAPAVLAQQGGGAPAAPPAAPALPQASPAPAPASTPAAGQSATPAPAPPSLKDLGFPTSQTVGSAAEQARLNRRSHMLQIHQKLGLLTTIPLAATMISGAFAGGRATSSTARNIHAALGVTTVGLYAATAYYAITAPHIQGVPIRGGTRAHVALMWIHLPGMILTPILGDMAYRQRSQGERVHGIARLHGQVATITLAAYAAALLVEARPHFFSNTSHATTSFFTGGGERALAWLHLGHAHTPAAASAFN
jgi:hypothetical protein